MSCDELHRLPILRHLIFHEEKIKGSQSCAKWVRSDSNSFVLCQVMIKKRSGESLLLILTCFPPDGAPSLVLRLFFLSSNVCPYQTLCICLYSPCIPGHIALDVSLRPILLSQLWPAPVLHRMLGVCLVLQSLLHYETVILQLSPITLCQYSPTAQCFVTTIHIHLCGTVWDKQTKKWVQLHTLAWLL